MIGRNTASIALALSFVLAAVATPALARSGVGAGYDARAQAIAEGVVHRTEALRECNELGAKSVQYTWGVTQGDRIRACMAQHGEVE